MSRHRAPFPHRASDGTATVTLVGRRLLIAGRVQAVGFRWHCRRAADAAGVAGSAVNRTDGRVEVVLEGLPDAVAEVERSCRSGPAHARVDRVEAADRPPTGLSGFTTG